MSGNHEHRAASRNVRFHLALVAACALGMLSAGSAFAGDDCLTVAVKERFVLPDGSMHDPAKLTLCTSRDLSPVTRLHVVSLDGKPIGLVRSRMGVSEGPARTAPMVLFRRLDTGALDLVGYAVPDGARDRTFVLQPALRARPARGELTAETIPVTPAIPADPPMRASSVAMVRAAD